jgi:hypothetical protein
MVSLRYLLKPLVLEFLSLCLVAVGHRIVIIVSNLRRQVRLVGDSTCEWT